MPCFVPRLLGFAALLLIGCVPDFSPDPRGGPPPVGDAAVARDARTRDATSPPVPDADRPIVDAGVTEEQPPRGCDLSGRWLMTERVMSVALGAQQIIRVFWYLELTQQASMLTVTRSMTCGQLTEGLPPFVANTDDTKVWPAYIQHKTYEGRQGSSLDSRSGCHIALDKAVVIRGATVEHYRDLSEPMPTVDQQASANMPGWEDWDGDGNPGISVRVSGTVTGTVYISSRMWTSYEGEVADTSRFTLPMNWEMQRVTLGVEGSPLLATDVNRDPDESQHFAEFARLASGQAEGNDDDVCAAVRELAPVLTPNAMQR